MKNLFAISFVVFSIMVLSLKDTLNLSHAILHKIPNPFHYHSNSSHHHEDLIDDHHHEEDHDHHEIEHDDDDHLADHHQHTLEDHTDLGINDEDDHQNAKKETKNSWEINWFINSLYLLKHSSFFELNNLNKNFTNDCFKTLTHAPLFPPPES